MRHTSILVLLFSLAALPAFGANKPNVVIVIGDDCTFSDLPLYGGTNVETPNIHRLASQGLTFDKAYVSMSMCAPCRAELYTGLYPNRNGVCWNHGHARPGTLSFAQRMGALGYRTGLAGKTHTNPREVFAFEPVGGLDPDCVKPDARFDLTTARAFVTRDDDQPFMLVLALVVPHVVWTDGDPTHFDQKAFDLPSFLADTPQTREDYAKYLAEVEVMDQQVGAVMRMLDETGHADDTILLFTSEQGGQWPGAKWTNYDVGVHTGMVVRWPGVVEPGTRTGALVQYADVLPTLIDAAGGEIEPGEMDGTSFLPVLGGDADTHRNYAYAMHNNVPEGPPYPIRSLTDGRHHYIRNLSPQSTYIERHIMGVVEHNPYWVTWMYASTNNQRATRLINRYMHRPAEELYDLQSDPFEVHNLIDDTTYAQARQRLSAELDRWLESQGDPGAEQDTLRAHRANR